MDWLVLLIFMAMVALLLANVARPATVFFTVLALFFLAGLIDLADVTTGFRNGSLMTLMLLVMVASVMDRTRLFTDTKRYFHHAPQSLWKATGLAALMSSVMNNTMVVALFLKLFEDKRRAHTMLLPICFASTLGGTCTLIGTSTNLVVNGFIEANGITPLGLTDFAFVGVPLTLVGIVYVSIVGPRLLKNPPAEPSQGPESYFVEAQIVPGSKLIGKTILENNLRNLERLFLSDMERDGKLYSPVSPDTHLQAGDTLYFTGDIKDITELQTIDGFIVSQEYSQNILNRHLVRAIVSHQSDLVGRLIKHANVRARFDAAVVAVRRGCQRLQGKIGLIELQAGDELVLAVGTDFNRVDSLNQHFYLYDSLSVRNKLSPRQSQVVIGAFLTMILGSLLLGFPLLKGLLVLLILWMVMGILPLNELKKSVPLELFLLVGSALGISMVLGESGAATLLASGLTGLFGGMGAVGGVVAIYLFTALLSEFMSNNAAAALAFPVALTTSQHPDWAATVDPMVFIFAVIFGASSSFMTSYGYQTNQMVASAGGYTSQDFLRLGLPMSILYGILTLSILIWRYFGGI